MSDMPNYPTGPTPPAGQPPFATRPPLPVPAEVQLSVNAWFASIAIGLVGGVLAYFATDTAAAAREAMAGSGLTAEQAELAVNSTLVLALVFSLVGLGLRVFFVFRLRAGRNWARIVLTVLAALSVIGTLFGFTTGFTIATAFDLIALLLVIAATVLMFRPAANDYFAARKAG